MWSGWVSVALGAWLILSPFLLGTPTFLNDLLLGGAIVIFGFLGALGARWASWTNVVLGLWLLFAPLVMRVSSTARFNEMIVGAVVALMGWISATASEDLGIEQNRVGGGGPPQGSSGDGGGSEPSPGPS